MKKLSTTLSASNACENRQRAWRRAAVLSQQPYCPWELDRFKYSLAQAEDVSIRLPEEHVPHVSFGAGLRGVLACLTSIGLWLLYVARHRAGISQPCLLPDASRVIALHGENTTRTRHVLQALASNERPLAGIILIGRVKNSPRVVKHLWAALTSETVSLDLPLVLPMSPRACLLALADMPRQMVRGIATSAQAETPIPFREEVAIAFRVNLGLVAARWWEQQGSGHEVLFGHTGTADTTLLEGAIRASGARSIHLVHGQATGPNFLGFSDVAVFRSRHDADTYQTLGCYGRCDTQPATEPDPRRGTSGLLLLSNLAHPMNAGFRSNGIKDELNLLGIVADAARTLGPIATPLLWKPHPAISALPTDLQAQLRSTANGMGFTELSSDAPLELAAAKCRWVISTPSTVALDLLQAGVLCIMIDPQDTLLDTAVCALPPAPCDGAGTAVTLMEISEPQDYSMRFLTAWNTIGPAQRLDLTQPFS